MDDDVKRIRASLLRKLRVKPKDGEEAAERHILLAVRFHRAAGLNQTEHGETKGWVQFFDEHFPKRPGWRTDDAERLWLHWRLGLVKWEAPRKGVTMTHGQPEAHSYREPDGTLCIDLESMWDDFEAAVDSFARRLRVDDERRAHAVERWRKRQWTVRHLVVSEARDDLGVVSASTASSTTMSTTINIPPAPSVSTGGDDLLGPSR